MTDRRAAVATLGERSVRSFVLDQRIRYSYSSPVTDLCQYLRIVPPAVHGHQRRRTWQLHVEGVASSTLRTFSDPWGNLTMAVQAAAVDDAVEFVMRTEVDVDTDGPAWLAPGPAPTGGPVPTRLTAADARIRELAADLGQDRGKGLPDVASLCERVHTSIAYQWGITGVHTTASEALAGGRGVCQDYAHIMLAVCRLAGVPARYVSGHLTGEGGSHAWVEVYAPDHSVWDDRSVFSGPAGRSGLSSREGPCSWQGWDPTHNRRTNGDYLVIAIGRDYADAAPLWGTFEGDGVHSTLVVEKRLAT
jgi:transglutaminase-like putative cysteine protease